MAPQIASDQDGLACVVVKGDQHFFVAVVVVRRRGRVHVGVHARRHPTVGGSVAVAETEFVAVATEPFRGQIADHERGAGPRAHLIVRIDRGHAPMVAHAFVEAVDARGRVPRGHGGEGRGGACVSDDHLGAEFRILGHLEEEIVAGQRGPDQIWRRVAAEVVAAQVPHRSTCARCIEAWRRRCCTVGPTVGDGKGRPVAGAGRLVSVEGCHVPSGEPFVKAACGQEEGRSIVRSAAHPRLHGRREVERQTRVRGGHLNGIRRGTCRGASTGGPGLGGGRSVPRDFIFDPRLGAGRVNGHQRRSAGGIHREVERRVDDAGVAGKPDLVHLEAKVTEGLLAAGHRYVEGLSSPEGAVLGDLRNAGVFDEGRRQAKVRQGHRGRSVTVVGDVEVGEQDVPALPCAVHAVGVHGTRSPMHFRAVVKRNARGEFNLTACGASSEQTGVVQGVERAIRPCVDQPIRDQGKLGLDDVAAGCRPRQAWRGVRSEDEIRGHQRRAVVGHGRRDGTARRGGR